MAQKSRSQRGFASMKASDPEKQRKIASEGGRAAHERGTAHEFTPEEARKAGRKGGLRSRSGGPSQKHDAAALSSQPMEES